jgi:hypothetical protein
MSLAWGSKFLEYSATALIVDTSPRSFAAQNGRTKLTECNILHTPRQVSDFQEISGLQAQVETVCENARMIYLHFQEAL